MSVKLGDMVKDNITGFAGVVIGRAEYLFGCVRILVQPKAMKDGRPVESEWVDEQRLDAKSTVKVGGPQKDPPK
jgi:hypothetical protein